MKKIFILIAVFTLAALVAATAAYFTDRESAQNNGFAAGTLDLTLDETAQSPDTLSNTDWKPGSEFERAVNLKNEGTVPIGDLYLQAETEISE